MPSNRIGYDGAVGERSPGVAADHSPCAAGADQACEEGEGFRRSAVSR